MNLSEGREIIDQIEKTRIEINKSRYHINNANFRISKQENNDTDDMWINIKKDYELKLKQNTEKLDLLYQKFYLLKGNISDLYWNMLLDTLGVVLAKTEQINHVENSLQDETELKKAIDQTEIAIEKCYEKLNSDMVDDDLAIVMNSQIRYYESDMKHHQWGIDRLNSIKNICEIKDESFFRV